MWVLAAAVGACQPAGDGAVPTGLPGPGGASEGPWLAITPQSGAIGTTVTAVGTGFEPSATVSLYAALPGATAVDLSRGAQDPELDLGEPLVTTQARTDGTFTVDFAVPATAAQGAGSQAPATVVIVASAGVPGATTTGTAQAALAEFTVEGAVPGATQAGASEEAAVAAAREALAAEAGVAAGAVSVVQVTPVEWSDACLGVSQPGVVCAQVVTPGYEVVLAANDQWYWYHTNTDGSGVVLAEVGPPGTPTP